jgi:hypothetical protein
MASPDASVLAKHYRFVLTYLRTNDLAIAYCDSENIPYDISRRGELCMHGRHLLETDAVLLQISEAAVNTQEQFQTTHDATVDMAMAAYRVAADANNAAGMVAAISLITRLSGLELRIEADNVQRLGERIQEVIATYRGRDVKDILEQAAPLAAAFIAEVATGGVPAATAERIAAAKNVLDRVKGTPVGMDIVEAKNSADEMMERIKKIESGRAKLDAI